MEKQETKITSQDIIDKEFRVKFRGFDIAEVDSFLEEVAENFFRLTEENTVLHEKLLALQEDLETAAGRTPPAQMELSGELENILEDLKQDLTAISADLISLKQERSSVAAMENSLRGAVAALQKAADEMKTQARPDIPAELDKVLTEFERSSTAAVAELAGLREDRRIFAGLRESLEEVIRTAGDAASAMMSPRQEPAEGTTGLAEMLADFKQETAAIRAELAGLKQEITAISGIRQDIAAAVGEQLGARFNELEAKLAMVRDRTAAAPPKKELLTAEVLEEPADQEETTVAGYREEEETYADDALEFLSEDDILDVDKLRNVFQSVLDDEAGGSPEDLEEDEASADLLFLDDDLLEDVPEPKVTFSMDAKENGKK